MFLKRSVLAHIILIVHTAYPADQNLPINPLGEKIITEEKIKNISSIESLCLGNFTFNPSDPNMIHIPHYAQLKTKYEIPLHQFKTYIVSAHQKIRAILTATPPDPQYHEILFIQASHLIQKMKATQSPDNEELMNVIKGSIDHQLSFAYFQLHLFSTKQHAQPTQQKCQHILNIITQNKPDSIRYLWREAPGEPHIPVDKAPFLDRYELYCRHSILSLEEKIRKNRNIEAQQKTLARIDAEKKQNLYCSIS